MTLYFEEEGDVKLPLECEALAKRVVEEALDYVGCPYEAEVNLLLTENAQIHEMNKEFRGIDRATDVLSFPMIDYPEPGTFDFLEEQEDCFDPESGELTLGDIVISKEKVLAQAEEYGHSPMREYAFLIAHSVLHLTGYDHMEDEEKNIKEIFNYYQSIGYIVVTNNDIKEIKKLISGKIVVFAGQSGAGKSSLLNKLDKNLNLETNEISKALGRGKHTTRCTTLYDIDSSLVADTPGFSSVDFRGMTKIDIRDNMKDMFDNLHNCKYKDCMHIKEDDCEVKNLVEQNKILLSRYNNYKSFIGGQK